MGNGDEGEEAANGLSSYSYSFSRSELSRGPGEPPWHSARADSSGRSNCSRSDLAGALGVRGGICRNAVDCELRWPRKAPGPAGLFIVNDPVHSNQRPSCFR